MSWFRIQKENHKITNTFKIKPVTIFFIIKVSNWQYIHLNMIYNTKRESYDWRYNLKIKLVSIQTIRRWFYPPQLKYYIAKKYLLPNAFTWSQNLRVHQLSWNCCNRSYIKERTTKYKKQKKKKRISAVKKNSIYSN